MKYLNTGKEASLKTVVCSGDLEADSKIAIFNEIGCLMACGKLFDQHVLSFAEKKGVATQNAENGLPRFTFV